MNLLIVNYEYPPLGGGASNASWFLAKALLAQGHAVSVLTSCYRDLRGRTNEDGIVVYRISAIRQARDRSNLFEMATFVVSGLFRLSSIIRREQIEAAIIFFTIPCGPIGYLAKKRHGIPYVVSLRGGDVPGLVPELVWMHRILQPLRRLILRNSQAIVANAPGLAALSMQKDPYRVAVISNGVNTDFFLPPDDPGSSGTAGSRPFQLIFVGRFHPQKNLFFLVDQLSEIRNRNLNFQLHLIGDGPERASLERHVEKLGLSESVIWHGWVDKNSLRRAYQLADCMINPSLYEGMPNTALEAMACGLPVIASNIPGNVDVVRDGATGYLFDLDKPEVFRERIERLISSPELAKSLGRKARAWVVTEFSWADVARRYLEIFHTSPRLNKHAI